MLTPILIDGQTYGIKKHSMGATVRDMDAQMEVNSAYNSMPAINNGWSVVRNPKLISRFGKYIEIPGVPHTNFEAIPELCYVLYNPSTTGVAGYVNLSELNYCKYAYLIKFNQHFHAVETIKRDFKYPIVEIKLARENSLHLGPHYRGSLKF